MISMIRGILSRIENNLIEIETETVGFEILMPLSDIEKLPAPGSMVRIYTYLNVREEELSLFGFLTRDEKDLFTRLITVSGIGPKGALGILSVMSPPDLRFAILAGDAKAIAKAPGIGQKTAQRLIIELKDKVSLDDGLASLAEDFTEGRAPEDQSARSEAAAALTVLGYSSSEALQALNGVETEGRSVEDILKDALKKLGR